MIGGHSIFAFDFHVSKIRSSGDWCLNRTGVSLRAAATCWKISWMYGSFRLIPPAPANERSFFLARPFPSVSEFCNHGPNVHVIAHTVECANAICYRLGHVTGSGTRRDGLNRGLFLIKKILAWPEKSEEFRFLNNTCLNWLPRCPVKGGVRKLPCGERDILGRNKKETGVCSLL